MFVALVGIRPIKTPHVRSIQPRNADMENPFYIDAVGGVTQAGTRLAEDETRQTGQFSGWPSCERSKPRGHRLAGPQLAPRRAGESYRGETRAHEAVSIAQSGVIMPMASDRHVSSSQSVTSGFEAPPTSVGACLLSRQGISRRRTIFEISAASPLFLGAVPRGPELVFTRPTNPPDPTPSASLSLSELSPCLSPTILPRT